MLGSAVSGLYLWTRRRAERRVGGCLLTGVSGGSLLLMVYVYWVG